MKWPKIRSLQTRDPRTHFFFLIILFTYNIYDKRVLLSIQGTLTPPFRTRFFREANEVSSSISPAEVVGVSENRAI